MEQKVDSDVSEEQSSNVISLEERQKIMPSILSEIMEVLDDLHLNASFNCKMNILLAKIAQMITYKRVMFQEFESSDTKIPNHYALNFMSSGAGKDRVANDLDSYIFKNFISYFRQKALDYKQEQENLIEKEAEEKFSGDKQKTRKNDYIRNEKEKLRDLDIEINLATPEGLFADAEAFNKAGFGSIFVKLSELGIFIQKGRQEDFLFLNCLFDAYDGKISSKSTKFDKRKSSIENMPLNALLHSDPTAFKKDIKKYFDQLMQMGLARRSYVSFQVNEKNLIETNPKVAKKIVENAYLKAKLINEKLFIIFSKIPFNAVYKLSNSSYENVLYPYKVKTTEAFNNNDDHDLTGKEILSRDFKALKLACLYACLNHPEEMVINENDVRQAISTIEKLSKDLKTFLEYNPSEKDKYDLIFHFLIQNLGQSFTKTKLSMEYKRFNMTRDDFRESFDEAMKVIAEVAEEKGYFLRKRSINNNSGTEVTLVKKSKPKTFGIEDL